MKKTAIIVAILLIGSSMAIVRYRQSTPLARAAGIPLALDQERALTPNSVLTSSTQSVNRYSSVLRKLNKTDVQLRDDGRLDVRVYAKDGPGELKLEGIDVHYLVPLLPYPHRRKMDAFDKANLMLAEYSRNGIELSQQSGSGGYQRFGAFEATPGLFNDDEVYRYENGKVLPNPGARPKRVGITNNCLNPGLWEMAAADTAGEMHHVWFEVPKPTIAALVRKANGIDASDEEIIQALDFKKDIDVTLDLDRLRKKGRTLLTAEAHLNPEKVLGGYSSQDSRRKVQRAFFKVERAGQPVEAKKMADLQPGDVFDMNSFVAPGVYTKEPMKVTYNPNWTRVDIAEVTPLTTYGPEPKLKPKFGHVEITLHSADGKQAIVVGNVPVDLLVFEEDFSIPGFGVGVLNPSEPIERRYLVFENGPAPYYAYLASVQPDGTLKMINNHPVGLEQIFLRPVRHGQDVDLHLTLVSYERIVDLVELEIPLQGELLDHIRQASATYTPPLYRTYIDSNTH